MDDAFKSISQNIDKHFEMIQDHLKDLNPFETVSMSRVSTDAWVNTQRRLGIDIVDAKADFGRPFADTISGYEWTYQTEQQQIDACLQYFKLNFQSAVPEVKFQDVSKIQQFLTSRLPLAVGFKGTSDIVGTLSTNDALDAVRSNMVFVIELKKDPMGGAFSNTSINQANSQLLCANHYSTNPVLHILTNLSNLWNFRWLSPPGQILSLSAAYPSEAYRLMQMYVEKRTVNVE
ncbi:hypothetical protein PPL_06930 [Heterostelium album PN500]|uniref:Uncharacterized protein n=1 Tax=Heterostelium pallidum (strain ATCC 26659 / Pp 5 / PN500) TaxID=670386 RepID=D3BDX7_HETP5|nr:hypothetical protein PPL_06930 [Heterostelium album PN500]EFA80108.1 hypothetical protein PPL_06930 [Heterostelium album PN500]|eukprot:XP_020432228.1 hypothetical protein PPL_06930 [Heterostelium album PN500]